MSHTRSAADLRGKRSGMAAPGWWLVASRELADLWVGGRALMLLILFSIVLGVLSFLLATNRELSLIPPKEMTFLTLQVTIVAGLFIGLVIGADSISGERDRETLEGLLLTPLSRRQIVAGKFIAAVSAWPAALAIAAPYLAVLSPDREMWGQGMLWGALVGSLLVATYTGLGMLVSIGSSSNRTSYSLSLVVFLLFLLPTQMPQMASAGAVGMFIKRATPIEAANHFLEKMLVNNRTLQEMGAWLFGPVLFAAIILGLLFWYASPGLRLEGGIARGIRLRRGLAVGVFVTLSLIVLGYTSMLAVHAQPTTDAERSLQISVDLERRAANTGDVFQFNTVVTNSGAVESSELVVAMNIVNLEAGDPVDPEDWSPQRVQYVTPLAPGQSADQTWTVRAILQGDYLVYLVVIPKPDGPDVTSQPVASSGIHLTVTAVPRLNPGGVLPLAIGMPVGLTLGMSLLLWLRRREIDTGGS